MQLQPLSLYCPINSQGIIQGPTVGPGQNIMVPSTSSTGPVASAPGPYYYPGVYQGIISFIESFS